MKTRITPLVLTLLFTVSLFAQDEGLRIFGYFQGNFHQQSDYSITFPINPLLNGGNPKNKQSFKGYNSFLLQQANVFLQNDFTGNFGEMTAFVNLQFQNSYNSKQNWGSFNLEEAWLKYSLSNAVNFKMGLLIPEFNAFNQIKNKTPLHPYVLRPIIYESTIDEVITIEDYVPNSSFLQFYGNLELNESIRFDYSINAGNSESGFIVNSTDGQALIVTGTDESTFKAIGGRIGLRTEEGKIGVSATSDRDKQFDRFSTNVFDATGSAKRVESMEYRIPRIRLGADFSYTLYGFDFQAEFVNVTYDLTDQQKNWLNTDVQNQQNALLLTGSQIIGIQTKIQMGTATVADLATLSVLSNKASVQQKDVENSVTRSNGLDKLFYYANLGYNLNDFIYVFANYSYIDDKGSIILAEGLDQLSGGLTIRPIDAAVVKVQVANQKTRGDLIGLDLTHFYLGLSVIF